MEPTLRKMYSLLLKRLINLAESLGGCLGQQNFKDPQVTGKTLNPGRFHTAHLLLENSEISREISREDAVITSPRKISLFSGIR